MKNKYELLNSIPRVFEGSTLYRVTQEELPVLKAVSVQHLTLESGGVREPHVHPNAHQLDFVISGQARIGILGPGGMRQYLDLKPGDVAFTPEGYPHWIENTGDTQVTFLLILTHERPETIELSEILAGVPKDTLATVLGLPTAMIANLPDKTITITHRNGTLGSTTREQITT